MPISSQNKVYLPDNSKSNQYILAEIKTSPELYLQYPNLQHCYQQLSQQFFSLANEFQLFNVHLIANDKLPVVRFHAESYCLPTEEQILFFYNPAYHEAQNLFTTPNHQARKIRLLFLATGEDVRTNAAEFHGKVLKLLQQFQAQLPVKGLAIKIRDHQHLSYDLFAKAKAASESYGYKLRSLAARYKARQLELPAHSALSYVHVTLPLSRKLKQQFAGSETDHSALYEKLAACFQQATAGRQLNRIAMVANGLTPLVRNSKFSLCEASAELLRLGFDPAADNPPFASYWRPYNLVESVHFILVAADTDATEIGYGRFVNRVEAALHHLSDQLHLDARHQDLIVRFHQHISYLL